MDAEASSFPNTDWPVRKWLSEKMTNHTFGFEDYDGLNCGPSKDNLPVLSPRTHTLALVGKRVFADAIKDLKTR